MTNYKIHKYFITYVIKDEFTLTACHNVAQRGV